MFCCFNTLLRSVRIVLSFFIFMFSNWKEIPPFFLLIFIVFSRSFVLFSLLLVQMFINIVLQEINVPNTTPAPSLSRLQKYILRQHSLSQFFVTLYRLCTSRGKFCLANMIIGFTFSTRARVCVCVCVRVYSSRLRGFHYSCDVRTEACPRFAEVSQEFENMRLQSSDFSQSSSTMKQQYVF
jgi:hypothetical protein